MGKVRRTCAKCGHRYAFMTHHETMYDCAFSGRKFEGEHLHLACNGCCFEWSEKTLDAKRTSREEFLRRIVGKIEDRR